MEMIMIKMEMNLRMELDINDRIKWINLLKQNRMVDSYSRAF